ncbi:unnamed protein product [Closterium sp. NIES-65]|nr:unnamed protein product [Closterium sp. NIES-65]
MYSAPFDPRTPPPPLSFPPFFGTIVMGIPCGNQWRLAPIRTSSVVNRAPAPGSPTPIPRRPPTPPLPLLPLSPYSLFSLSPSSPLPLLPTSPLSSASGPQRASTRRKPWVSRATGGARLYYHVSAAATSAATTCHVACSSPRVRILCHIGADGAEEAGGGASVLMGQFVRWVREEYLWRTVLPAWKGRGGASSGEGEGDAGKRGEGHGHEYQESSCRQQGNASSGRSKHPYQLLLPSPSAKTPEALHGAHSNERLGNNMVNSNDTCLVSPLLAHIVPCSSSLHASSHFICPSCHPMPVSPCLSSSPFPLISLCGVLTPTAPLSTPPSLQSLCIFSSHASLVRSLPNLVHAVPGTFSLRLGVWGGGA